jgi:predicted amidohydrolase
MSSSFEAAAVQLCAGPDKEANLDRAEAFVRAGAARGAALVVLPEVFAWRGARADEHQASETIPGPTSDRCAALARELGIHLVAGSILERVRDSSKVFNTCTVFAPDGGLLARYRKTHLFDVDITGQVTVRESDTRQAGGETVVVATALGAIGLSVCYDLRFPELYRRLVDAGAEIVCVPSAFTFPTGAAHWEVLLRARAIERRRAKPDRP